jgi:hypothetical protein
MDKTFPNKDVNDILATFTPETRNLALAVRTLVLKMIPDITEQADVKARIIGYGYGPKYVDSLRDNANQSGSESGDGLRHGAAGPKETS